MLRPTAARAFGSRSNASSPVAPASSASPRDEVVRKLFRELHERLGAHSRDPESLSVYEISAERARPGGLEFHLQGPAATLSFVDTLEGTIAVEVGDSDGGPRQLAELLSVQREGAAFRPIRKPIRSGHRTGFKYTSVAELGRRYAAWARGGPGSTIDT